MKKKIYLLSFLVLGDLIIPAFATGGPNKASLDCFTKLSQTIDDRPAAMLCNTKGAGEAALKCFVKLEPDYDDVAAALVCMDGSPAALQCFTKTAADSDDIASAMICTHTNAIVLPSTADDASL